MSFDVAETYLILPRGWWRAQQRPAIRYRIGKLVVEELAIEVWDHQHTIQYCNLMNKCHGEVSYIIGKPVPWPTTSSKGHQNQSSGRAVICSQVKGRQLDT